ncbi:AaceriADL009Wp [[Ashbya] aceris (nom. inval.)]|nr:AaceriADL009Wp [[Ashbya] aceris (nom. inval.)]
MDVDASGAPQLELAQERLVAGRLSAEGSGNVVSAEDIVAPDCSTPLSSAEVLEELIGGGGTVGSGGSGRGLRSAGSALQRLDDTQVTAVSGAMAGFVSGIMVCPLDVAKTRLQAQGAGSGERYYRGILGTLRAILRDEGVAGLYKGLAPIVLGYFPTWMLYFSIYERCKQVYPTFLPGDFVSHAASALTAGAVSTALTNPIWVVKTRLMIQSDVSQDSTNYRNTLDAFRKMYQSEGLKVFYSGLVPSLFGLFHVAIHFPVYEKLKIWLHRNTPAANNQHLDHNKLQLDRLIVASCLSKVVASTITYPHEILRTRMQVRQSGVPPSLLSLLSSIRASEGYVGFYSGFATNLVRTVPASVITLVSFEYFRKYLRLWNDGLLM